MRFAGLRSKSTVALARPYDGVAFSTANEMALPQLSGPWRIMTTLNDERLDPVYLAAVEAVVEAILNALCAATDVALARPVGGVCRAIDTDMLMDLLNGSATVS